MRFYEEHLREGHPQYKQRAYSQNNQGDGQNKGQGSMVQFSYKRQWKQLDWREHPPFPTPTCANPVYAVQPMRPRMSNQMTCSIHDRGRGGIHVEKVPLD